MSSLSAILEALAANGATIEMIIAAVKAHESETRRIDDERKERLREGARDRKRLQRERQSQMSQMSQMSRVTSCDVRDTTSSPLDVPPFPSPAPLPIPPLNPPTSDNSNPERPAKRAVAYSPEFEAWWACYPNRKEKPNAFSEWRKAIGKTTPEVLQESLLAYLKTSQVIDGFAPYPAKWLKQERWAEDHQPAQSEKPKQPPQKPHYDPWAGVEV